MTNFDYLRDSINDTMKVYKTAFEEGKRIGYAEGYNKGLKDAQEIAIKIIKED